MTRTACLIVLALSLTTAAYAAPQPVWVTANAGPNASAVVATIQGPGVKETLGLWPFPLTGEEPLSVGFAPNERRPGGWAAIDWLPSGSYQVTSIWFDQNGAVHPGATTTLVVP